MVALSPSEDEMKSLGLSIEKAEETQITEKEEQILEKMGFEKGQLGDIKKELEKASGEFF